MIGDYIEFIFEHLPMAKSLRDEVLSCGKYEKALEIGCSIGGNTRYIAKISDETVGIDLSRDRVEIARKRFDDIKFEIRDATATGYPDNNFDAAFLILVLHEAPNPSIIKEACRIAKEVVVLDYNYPLSGPWAPFFRFLEGDKIRIFYDMDIEKIFEGWGYRVVESKVFGGNFRKWVFREKK